MRRPHSLSPGCGDGWEEMGKSRYPEARELFITADAGDGDG